MSQLLPLVLVMKQVYEVQPQSGVWLRLQILFGHKRLQVFFFLRFVKSVSVSVMMFYWNRPRGSEEQQARERASAGSCSLRATQEAERRSAYPKDAW